MKRSPSAPTRRAAVTALTLLFLVAAAPAARAGTEASTRFTLEHKQLPGAGGRLLQADAGTLLVPENRSVATSRRIPVRFLHLHSRAKAPRAPIFFLAGGPGDRAVSEDARTLAFWAPFLEVADVVLVDQRGVSDPALRWSWDGPLPLQFFASADSAARHVDAVTRRAAATIRARGVDLAGYNTVESAEDLDELRAALGIERVSLLAFSYGTHLATCFLRRHGERVESAVMLGTEGPDQTLKLPWTMDVQLRRLALLAAADPHVGARVPDLVALYDRVIARLGREPVTIPLATPDGRDTVRVTVGPFGLRYLLRADIGDASDLVVFPRLLWSLDQGDPSVLAWFVRKRAGVALGAHAMNEAMDAASGCSPERLALIDAQARTSRFADVVNFPYPAVTAAWGVPDLGTAFRAPLVSPVRTLFVSGSLDCNTPPQQAEEMRWGFADATHLVVENAGHEQTFWQNPAAVPVVVDFLAGRDVRERKISWPKLEFVPLEGRDGGHPSVAR